jgi:cobalamin biosynthesis protein CbiD
MRRRILTGVCAAAAIAAALLLLLGGGGGDEATAKPEPVPGEPTIEIVSPRNGSRQENRAVVARAATAIGGAHV